MSADDFNRANATTLGSNWVGSTNGWQVASNRAQNLGAATLAARWIDACPSATAQYSQATYAVLPSVSIYHGPAVNMPSAVSGGLATVADFYVLTIAGSGVNTWTIRRKDNLATTTTALGTAVTQAVTAGDVIRLERDGDNLIAYRNGTEVMRRSISGTGVTLSNESTALYVGLYGTQDTTAAWDDWSGGALGVTARELTTGTDTTNSASYATASITPSANKLILAYVQATQSAVPNAPSVALSGCGLTWVEILDTGTSERWRTHVFRAMGASPTTGAVTITCGAAATNALWSIVEYGNVDTSGTNGSGAVAQAKMSAYIAGPPVNVTFDTTPTGPTVAGVINNGGFAISAVSPYVLTGAVLGTSPTNALASVFSSVGQTTAGGTWTGAASGYALGLELVPSAPSGPPNIAGGLAITATILATVPSDGIRISALSDFQLTVAGGWTSQMATAKTRLEAVNPDYLVITGDTADDGASGSYALWQTNLGTWKPKSLVVPGNHDYYGIANWWSQFGTGTYAQGASSAAPWFSVNIGGWHLVFLVIAEGNATGEPSYAVGSAQYQWLQADLAANSLPLAGFWHVPRYSEDTTHGDTADVGPIVNLMMSYGCQFILNGHVHVYQRFPRADGDGNLTSRGPVELATSGIQIRTANTASVLTPDYINANTDRLLLTVTLKQKSWEWSWARTSDGTVLDSGTRGLIYQATTGLAVTASFTAAATVPSTPGEMFISPAELASLPTTGAAWTRVLALANAATNPDFTDIASYGQQNVLAAALAYARNGSGPGVATVISKIQTGIASGPTVYHAVYRQLCDLILAADLVGMSGSTTVTPYGQSSMTFDAYMSFVLDQVQGSAPAQWNTLRKCTDASANNHGGFARMTFMACAIWLNSGTEKTYVLDRLLRFLGDTSKTLTFVPSADFLPAWTINGTDWTGQGIINPAGDSVKDGVLTDDACRGGGPPTIVGAGLSYSAEVLDGTMMASILAYRNGLKNDILTSSNNALRRAAARIDLDGDFNTANGYSGYKNMPYLWNYLYGMALATVTPGPSRTIVDGEWMTSGTWLSGAVSGGGFTQTIQATLAVTATFTAVAVQTSGKVISASVDVTTTISTGIRSTRPLGATLAITATRTTTFGGQNNPTFIVSLGIVATIAVGMTRTGVYSSTTLILPPDVIIDGIHQSVTRVLTRVEIYQSDNSTLWMGSSSVSHTAGEVSLDRTRAERRMLNISMTPNTGAFTFHPTSFWYDKIIKVYRGVLGTDNSFWERKLGEFMIDTIADAEDGIYEVTGRDFTKKLMLDDFNVPTTFAINQPLEEIIRAIATNGGISKFALALTGVNTTQDYTFDANTSRWDACAKLAFDYGFDLYFDYDGYLVLNHFADPYLDTAQYTFKTGVDGNLMEISKSAGDGELFNNIVVTGNSDGVSLPAFAVATNTEPTSPTRVAAIGRRTFPYTSAMITDDAQAQQVANNLLSVKALEQFNVNLAAIVVPYLEPGIIVQFDDPKAAPGAPIKYLLSGFTIPLTLDSMPVDIRRVTKVRA